MNLKQLFLVIIISSLIFSCKKDETSTPSAALPVKDSVYLTAKVGVLRAFKANLNRVTVDTVFSQVGKLTQITAFDDGNYKMIITFQGRDTGTYVLGSKSALNYVSVYNSIGELWRSTTEGGKLKITKYDILNHKISGTFTSELRKSTSDFNFQYIDDGEFVDLKITGF